VLWERRTLTGAQPGAREGHAMAYDSARGKVVLFGGATSAGYMNDTWEWDGAAATWTDRTPAGDSPSPRILHAMAYDSSRARTVLYGGASGDDGTWEWDGVAGTWNNRTPGGGSLGHRERHAMAYDASRGKVVLFGGESNAGLEPATWEWDGAAGAWTNVTPAGDSPTPRDSPAMVYDDARRRIVLSAGGGDIDTWDWDGAAWILRWPPGPVDPDGGVTAFPRSRLLHAMAFDSARQRTVLFGGEGGGHLGDTWEWDGAAGLWVQRTPAGATPPAREAHAMAYDGARGNVVLFGGRAGSGDVNDTWEYHVTGVVTGAPCAATFADRCASLACVDGVCCNSPSCSGACQVCNAPGSPGLCANAAPGMQDPDSCSGASACDGRGGCRLANGQGCASDVECGSGHCADGLCCDSACTGDCRACDLPGHEGTCASVAVGVSDTCVAPGVCDGHGACKLPNGATCGSETDCLSGFCADGVCCETSCALACVACNLPGQRGACVAVAMGAHDPVSAAPCTAPRICDGAGTCATPNGYPCKGLGECLSGNCVDGVCCAAASCAGICRSCNAAGAEGACANVAAGTGDPDTCPVANGMACDGQARCKTANGRSCAVDGDCGSGHCAGGTCCETACDGICQSCALPAAPGTCASIPVGQVDAAHLRCIAPMACDGQGACKLAQGRSCQVAGDCASGACADGYCCDSPCAGACLSCDQPGHLGSCLPLNGECVRDAGSPDAGAPGTGGAVEQRGTGGDVGPAGSGGATGSGGDTRGTGGAGGAGGRIGATGGDTGSGGRRADAGPHTGGDQQGLYEGCACSTDGRNLRSSWLAFVVAIAFGIFARRPPRMSRSSGRCFR